MNQWYYLLLMMPTMLFAGKTEDLKKEISLNSPERCQSSLFVCATAEVDADNMPCLCANTVNNTQEEMVCLSQGQPPIICPTPIRHSPSSKTASDKPADADDTTTPPLLLLDEQGFFENLPINQDSEMVQKAESFSTNKVMPNAASKAPISLPYKIKPYFFCALKKTQNKKPNYLPTAVPSRHNEIHKTKKEIHISQENPKLDTNTISTMLCCGVGIALQKKDSTKKRLEHK